MELKDFSNLIDEWDQKVILKYNGLGGKVFTYVLRVISFFGRETLWISLIAFFLVIWYDPFVFSYLSATFLTGLILILGIKQSIRRPRPFEKIQDDRIIVLEKKPTSKSFPSWHSFNVVAHGLLIGMIFLRSPVITFLFLTLAFLVSFSRVQLGVHYPTDVICGYVFGVVGVLIVIFWTGPLFFGILTYLEQFVVYEIQYRQVNLMIFENIGYLIFCISVFFIIFLFAVIKSIMEFAEK